jgi:ribonucleoside-diphosphate reductase alpha chain
LSHPEIAPFESEFAHETIAAKYMRPHGETHWYQTADRAVRYPMEALAARTGRPYVGETVALRSLVRSRAFMPGGRYLYATGNDLHQTQNCLLLRCEDTREGWSHLSWKGEMSLLTGAGVGVYWGDLRESGALIKRTGGVASGPVPKAIAFNELGRAAVQGGDRRSAIWGGLLWSHPDIFKWITAKDWPDYIKEAKKNDPFVPAALDMTNISVCLDDAFFAAFEDPSNPQHEHAQTVYWETVDHMTQTGEPGFSVDLGAQREEKLRNACTEIVSADDSDICNLGGLVLPRFDSVAEFEKAVRLGVLYLTAGTVYSDVPYTAEQSPDGHGVDFTRDKNRRLGLDLLGVDEFLIRRGLRYGTDDAFAALDPYMRAYRRALEFAHEWQDEANLSLSVAATSGAPTGTRGIGAETTTGWQKGMVAYKRRVITSKAHESDMATEYHVIDPTIAKLLKEGAVKPTDKIEDAATLAYDYERIFKTQAYAQENTDQAISMTVNLPHVMRDAAERRTFGETLYRYLPKLRGITVYPDGAIPGQPITPVPLEEALNAQNVSIEEDEEKCASGVCGL